MVAVATIGALLPAPARGGGGGMSCADRLLERERPTRRVHAPASHDLRSVLGVLRRPATAADVPPRSALGSSIGILRSLSVDGVRLLGILPDGTHVFLLPGRSRRPPHVSRACLRSLPRGLRRALVLELRSLARLARHGVVELFAIAEDGTGVRGQGAYDAAAIKGRGIVSPTNSSIFRALTTVHGVVPDGVASVTVSVRGASATAAVADNFFVAQLAARLPPDEALVSVTWRGTDGSPIKTVHAP